MDHKDGGLGLCLHMRMDIYNGEYRQGAAHAVYAAFTAMHDWGREKIHLKETTQGQRQTIKPLISRPFVADQIRTVFCDSGC